MTTPFGATRARCRDCAAPMLWAVTVTGKRMPLDPAPRPDGNVFFPEPAIMEALASEGIFPGPEAASFLSGKVGVVGAAAKARMVAARARNGLDPIDWYVSHFATCPEQKRAQGGRR